MGERVASCCRRSERHWGFFFLTPVFLFPSPLGAPERLSFFARSGAYICGCDRGSVVSQKRTGLMLLQVSSIIRLQALGLL